MSSRANVDSAWLFVGLPVHHEIIKDASDLAAVACGVGTANTLSVCVTARNPFSTSSSAKHQ